MQSTRQSTSNRWFIVFRFSSLAQCPRPRCFSRPQTTWKKISCRWQGQRLASAQAAVSGVSWTYMIYKGCVVSAVSWSWWHMGLQHCVFAVLMEEAREVPDFKASDSHWCCMKDIWRWHRRERFWSRSGVHLDSSTRDVALCISTLGSRENTQGQEQKTG